MASSSARLAIACTLATLLATAACARRPPAAPALVDVQILAFNDFHGNVAPPTGSNGRIGTVEAGGVEYLATHLKALAAANPNTVIVSAGDNIGASPLLSGLFHDEPTIEALGATGLAYSAVGNHELDEGWAELYRMQHGGCHPVDGCQDQTPFAGAPFEYLAANILLDPAKADARALARTMWQAPSPGPQPLFPPFAIRDVGGIRIGFIGLTLHGAPAIVASAGIAGLTFLPEAPAANAAARRLRAEGAGVVIVLIHEGGVPAGDDPNGCGITGPIRDIVRGLSRDVDVVVSGHTHRGYVCTLDGRLVTSAASFGRLVTDIDLRISPATGRVIGKTARNVIVTRDVAPDAGESALLAHYRPLAAAVADRPVGTVSATIGQTPNAAGESALGDLVADGMLAAAHASGEADAAVAFTNIGGLRSDLVPGAPAPGRPAGAVTYGQVFDVLPFGNVVIVRTMTGGQIVRMLEQQWAASDFPHRMLQVSAGFAYAWDNTRSVGHKIDRASVRIGGRPLVPAARYRVVSTDFIWGAGDGFTAAAEAVEPVALAPDTDVFSRYLAEHAPVGPGPQNRIHRIR